MFSDLNGSDLTDVDLSAIVNSIVLNQSLFKKFSKNKLKKLQFSWSNISGLEPPVLLTT